MELQCTIVWQKNWDAMHKHCETCNGAGHVEQVSCSWCGDGESKDPASYGSGKHWRYIINRGSSRSSKTYSLIDCYDLYARANNGKRLTTWRETKRLCVDTVLQDLKKHMKDTKRWKVGHTFHETTKVLTYDTESTFEICGTDDEEAVHGLTQSAAWLNEPYKISRETFDQIDQRTSDFIFIDYNPKRGHWIEDLIKNPRALLIISTFKDNPFCPSESRKKILGYQPVELCDVVEKKLLSTQEARDYDLQYNPMEFTSRHIKELIRCRENEANKTANAFNWCVYGLGTKAEKPHRIFRWEEISVEDYLKMNVQTLYIGNDWGKVDPWAIIEVKYYDGSLYVREKNYQSENEIRARLTPHEVVEVNREEEGIVTWMYERLGISKSSVIIADSNRPLKIARLRRHDWECYGANKPKGSVIDGIDLLHNLKVYYTSDSPNIKYEQENYSYKVDASGTQLEEPEDLDNHTIDAIRYVALYLQAQDIIRRV